MDFLLNFVKQHVNLTQIFNASLSFNCCFFQGNPFLYISYTFLILSLSSYLYIVLSLLSSSVVFKELFYSTIISDIRGQAINKNAAWELPLPWQ